MNEIRELVIPFLIDLAINTELDEEVDIVASSFGFFERLIRVIVVV